MDISAMETALLKMRKAVVEPLDINGLTFILLDALRADHPADWVVDKHRHPWFEFNYVTSGSFYTTLLDQEFLTEAGQFFLIPPGALHSHRHRENSSGDDGFCLRWQLINSGNRKKTAFAEEVCRVLHRPRAFAWTARQMPFLQEVSENRSITGIRLSVISGLVKLYEQSMEQADITEADPQHQNLATQATLYMEAYYDRKLNVDEIARSLHVSYRTLARIYKKQTGCTLIERLNAIRIQAAMRLLKQTDAPLKQIAIQVGFDNEFYLSNTFRKNMQLSPAQFRNKYRG